MNATIVYQVRFLLEKPIMHADGFPRYNQVGRGITSDDPKDLSYMLNIAAWLCGQKKYTAHAWVEKFEVRVDGKEMTVTTKGKIPFRSCDNETMRRGFNTFMTESLSDIYLEEAA